jgi:type I restriction enzyme R subunit
MLRRKLPRPDGGGPLDLGDDVVLQSYKLKLEDKGDLTLRVGEGGP